MPELVVFRLVAPLMAFGDIAVGERRGTGARPSHSMIAGLLAGALGLPRDAPGHEALADGFRLAVRTDAAGTPLADFHTAQAPPQRRGRRYATRREELADRHANGTIVSRRDYRADAAFTVLLWPTETAVHPPAALAEALNRPAFAPYAGRRSCALAFPVDARVIAAATVIEGLRAYDAAAAAPHGLVGSLLPLPTRSGEIAFDAALADVAGLVTGRAEWRRDRLASRARWQFEPREEHVAVVPPPGEAGSATAEGTAP